MKTSRLAASTVVALSVAAFAASQPRAQAPAQAPDAKTPLTFEAASVKPNKSGQQGSSIRRQPGGRLTATNMPLRALITFAYQLQGFQLVDDPSWIRNENFDIVAKMEGDPPPVMPGTGPDPHMVAMRTLLAERFKLTVHRETREMDIYALVLARPDGTLGTHLKRTTTDCESLMKANRGGPPPTPPGPNAPFLCGSRGTPGRLTVNGMPLSQFANSLSGQVQRVVVDRTGLTGAWDFEITTRPSARSIRRPASSFQRPIPTPRRCLPRFRNSSASSCNLTKGPVEVLVVDRVEPLTPD